MGSMTCSRAGGPGAHCIESPHSRVCHHTLKPCFLLIVDLKRHHSWHMQKAQMLFFGMYIRDLTGRQVRTVMLFCRLHFLAHATAYVGFSLSTVGAEADGQQAADSGMVLPFEPLNMSFSHL